MPRLPGGNQSETSVGSAAAANASSRHHPDGTQSPLPAFQTHTRHVPSQSSKAHEQRDEPRKQSCGHLPEATGCGLPPQTHLASQRGAKSGRSFRYHSAGSSLLVVRGRGGGQQWSSSTSDSQHTVAASSALMTWCRSSPARHSRGQSMESGTATPAGVLSRCTGDQSPSVSSPLSSTKSGTGNKEACISTYAHHFVAQRWCRRDASYLRKRTNAHAKKISSRVADLLRMDPGGDNNLSQLRRRISVRVVVIPVIAG